MKLHHLILTITIAFTVLIITHSTALSMDDPGFTITRMVMSENVAEREPVGQTNTFSADTGTVFCFLETKDIEFDRIVSFVWYYEGQEKARIDLPIQKGRRWRTYSSKKIANLKGNWTVELQEESGIILNSVSFQVQ